MEVKTVGVACDHAGFALKKYVLQYLEEHGYAYKDYGTYSDMSCDYPTSAMHLAKASRVAKYIPALPFAAVVRV